jgi:hypothetical protein
MPKRVEPLSPSQVANAKPKASPYKLRDGGGLFLLVEAERRKGLATGLPASRHWQTEHVVARHLSARLAETRT